MAIIYECDGCGKQTKDSREVKGVEVEIKSDKGQGPRIYQCCDRCERRLREQANPGSWPRPANSAVA